MSKLKLIPEEILKERLPQLIESNIICDECKRIIKVICFPYAYDSDNHEVVYASKCPICKKIIYSKE